MTTTVQPVGVSHVDLCVVLLNPRLEMSSVSESAIEFFAGWRLGPAGPHGVPEAVADRLRAVVARMHARGALSAVELFAQTLSMHVSVLRAADGSLWCSATFAVFATRDPVRLAVRDFGLTHRESQVLDLILHGLAARDIAALLGVSLLTVHDHCRHLRQKTGSRTTTAMAASLLNGASWRSPGCIAQDAG
jgi:DNA-binding CsgD family transcriptional regulator